MTQVEAGKFFGGGPVAFSKYETDDLIPSDSMVALLKLAMNDPNVAARLREQHGQHVRVGVGSFEAEGSASDLWFSEMLEANYSTLKNALSASKNLKFEEGASWMIRN
jgi:HTH-type transcriptional regulator/antitoxin MqsA